MRKLQQMLVWAAAGAALLLGTGQLAAQDQPPPQRQGRGNFDPEQMRARMLERYREAFEVKDDAEWKLIETRITKVTDAQRDARSGGMGRMFGGPGGPGGRRGGDQGGDQTADTRRARFGGEPNPDAEALQKSIDAKASNDEIKAKLAKYRESQKAKQASLEKAQDELRKVLSVRQEANATLMGLL